MIPETTDRRECKAAVLDRCTLLPEPGEVYTMGGALFSGVDGCGRRWIAQEPYQDGELTFKTVEGDNWQAIEVPYWEHMLKNKLAKFIGYDS